VKKKYIALVLSLCLACSISVPTYAADVVPGKDNKVQAIEKLDKVSNEDIKLSEKDGQVFLSGELSTSKVPSEKNATKFLDENKVLFEIDSASKDLKVIEVKKDDIGYTNVKYVQVIDGIEVLDSCITVHFDKDGVIKSINGKLNENKTITRLGNKTISEGDALEIAKKQYTYKTLSNEPKAEKFILTKGDKNYEVYKINIYFKEPTIGNYDVYVEVNSGEVISTESNIRYDGPVTGSGIDVQGVKRDLNLYQVGTTYQMIDITKAAAATRKIITYDMQHSTTKEIIASSNSNEFTNDNDKASVSAHYNASKVIDFYKTLFNRNSLDDKGMEIESYTHFDTNYNNAFWDGYEMVYGDGDGVQFTYLSGDLDVVGHEMTHGLIDNCSDDGTQKLSYHNQSGALNESMADVFGVLISTYDKYGVATGGEWKFDIADWVIGDYIYTPLYPGDALRSLSDPTKYGQPDHLNSYLNSPDTKDGDWGGVHTNSGIPNKAAYAIANSIGMEKTAKVYYRALTQYMNGTTNFEQAEDCLIQAATDLYPGSSAEVTVIKNAFNSVGIIGVTGVNLDKTTASLKVGDSINLLLAVNPTNAINKNVTWSSNNPTVATVDNAGKVAAIGKGTANIRVTTENGGFIANCIVTVSSNDKPVISGATDKTIKIGDSFDPKAGVTATDPENGDLTSNIVVSGTVDTTKTGAYTLTYSVTDSDSNTVSKSITCSVAARNVQVEPLIGIDRYDTAVKLSNSQFGIADTIVIANGEAMADGLAATPLATYKNSPLLLTSLSSLPETTKNEIKRLKAKNAIIVGGTGVVTDNVLSELKALGVTTITRLGGADRYDTSIEIANYIDKNCYDVSQVVISNGYGEADALSIASAAGRDRMPIILVEIDEIPANVYNFLKSEGLGNAYIIGGTGVVSNSVLNKIDGITSGNVANNRLGGINRYATNAMVIEKFYGNVVNKAYIAKGQQLVDALAAGPVAALNGAPVILSDDDLSPEQKTILNKRYGNTIIRTGGGIADKAVNSLKSCLE